MDKKVLFQALMWSMAVYLLLMYVVGKMYPPQQPPGSPTTQPAVQPIGPDEAASPPP